MNVPAKARKSHKVSATSPPAASGHAGSAAWAWPLGLFGFFFLACEVYGPALHGPFVFDDRYIPFVETDFSAATWRHWLNGARPLTSATFWFNYEWSKFDTFSYHLVNLLFHSLNSLLAYAIVRQLLRLRGADEERSGIAATFCGALFLLHPVQTEAVSYIVSRSENLSVLLTYAAFAAFLYRRREAVSWVLATGILLLFLGATAAKEHAVVLPAVLMLADYYWNPHFSFQGIRRNWKLYASLLAAAGLGVAFVVQLLSVADSAGFRLDIAWYRYFFTQCRVLFVYLRLFAAPFGQNVDYDFPLSNSLADPAAAAGLAALLLLVGLALWFRRRYPLASFGFLVFLVLMAPTSSVVPIQDPIAERRMYLPFIGLLLIAAEAILQWKIARRPLVLTLAGALAVCALLTYQRNQVWASTEALWSDTAAKSPRKARPRFQLAYAYFEQQRCPEALREYDAVGRLQAPDYRLSLDWALAYDCAGQYPEAAAKLTQAIAFNRTAHAVALLGVMQTKQNQHPAALSSFDAAEKIDPRFEWTFLYRGNLFALENQFAAAKAQYLKCLAINPRNEGARTALAAVEARLQAKT